MKEHLQTPPQPKPTHSSHLCCQEYRNYKTGAKLISILNNRLYIILALLLLIPGSMYAQRTMENLSRGVVAVRTSPSEVFVSWRVLGTDPADIAFNLYRGETKLNSTPITGATNFVDQTSANEGYSVRPVINNAEQAASAAATVWTNPHLSLPLQRPAGGTTPDGVSYTYSPNDCSVGDLDGDGEYEIIVKWDPSNAKDNSQAGYIGNVYLDAYKLNGTRLWRIDLGKNIRAGAHYSQFIVYDLDGDGKAELAVKTADGTKDGAGTVIGNPEVDYRNDAGYILHGPEYLTIFNGETGAAMATTDYIPARGNVASWGDDYGNRVDRFLAGVGYFDGQRPSLLMTRGYYTRAVLVAWDWRNGQLTQRWIFDSNADGNSVYASQGNHSLSINDVDGDGKDEVMYGSMAIDDNGTGLYSTGLGHGDAQHVGDLDPDRPGLESWTAHESPSQYQGNGLWMRDAHTGEQLWGVPSDRDVGRAMTADIDPRYKGYEAWGAAGALYDVKGQQISATRPGSMNFGSWWDGDLQRELLDGTTIDKWNYTSSTQERLLSAQDFGAERNNGTKANPGLSADILGDWREEVIYRHSNNSELLIFTTTIPTTHRFYTFMHDPQYRVSVAWQNVAYNQPPHTSFYVGEEMDPLPTPSITLVDNTDGKTPAIFLTAGAGDGKVFLGWSTLNYTLARLEVYRDTDPNPSGRTRVTSLSGTVTSHIDEGLTNGTTYYYWIKGYDANGIIVNSAAASATPEGVSLPPPPAIVELAATAGDGQVDLAWSIQNVNIQQVEIFRDTDSNPSGRGRVGIVGASGTSFTDPTVTNGTTYWYWLKVIDVDGKAHGSAGVEVTPEGTTPPPPPKTVVLTATGGDRYIDLSWTVENIEDITALEVFRDTDANPSGRSRIASLSGSTRNYADVDVQNGTTYWYWIKITDPAAVTNSNAAEATPVPLDGTYTLTALHSALVLDVNKGCTDNSGNSNLVQHTGNSSVQQQWQLSSAGDGYYSITNVACGQALGVKAQSANAEGANIVQWSYGSEANQQWALIRLENGFYNIVNRATGLSVTVADASTASGANVKQFSYAGGAHQQFSLTPVSAGARIAFTGAQSAETLSSQQHTNTMVFPNPATTDFSIRRQGHFAYAIVDQLGRVVMQGQAEEELTTGSTLQPGYYIVNIKAEGNTEQYKLIKR
jgi:rhamnogalacturonan endolyase